VRLAVLADIHGNLPALEAVLADLRGQSPDAVYLAGDQINRCPWNTEVLDLLATTGWPAIQGNHEYVIGRINTPENFSPFTNRQRFAGLWWTQAQLSPTHLATIRQWPAELHLEFGSAPPIRLIHGIPGNPFVGLLPSTDDVILQHSLREVVEPVVITAHTHRPMIRQSGRWLILNGGSIGAPYNGDPRAQYLLIDAKYNRWQPTLRQVAYDRTGIADAFARSGFLAAAGPLAELDLRTILTGEPWASDFGHWMKSQPPALHSDLPTAVQRYLQTHGPGHWAFDLRQEQA
jgi:predicted phosphodiesterase